MRSLGVSPGPFVIADYSPITAFQGGGVIPANGATVSVVMNRISPSDDYVWVTNNRLMYLRTPTLYANNETDIQALLGAAVDITPSPPFTDKGYVEGVIPSLDSGSDGDYLYIIHDYYTT